MKNLLIFGLICFITSCKSKIYIDNNNLQQIKIDTLLQGKFSIRAILIQNNKVYFGADNSKIGFVNLTYPNQNSLKTLDTVKTEFRSIASNSKSIFALNVANPAKLYKISKDFNQVELVYSESHEKVFFDSMQFWNVNEGIAMGDPINDCFNIIITRDRGKNWNKISCNALPKLEEGEAAFAASNTNIVIKNDNTWIVSGGKKSRIFHSTNKGLTWKVYNTPIIEGQSMTGIFTADFYDDTIGIVSGGDYEQPNQNYQNKAITFDAGKTWCLIADNQSFGYTSCIQFAPNSNGKKIMSVGANGIYFSADMGQNWTQLSTDPTLYTIRFINSKTAIAAGKNKIIRIKLYN